MQINNARSILVSNNNRKLSVFVCVPTLNKNEKKKHTQHLAGAGGAKEMRAKLYKRKIRRCTKEMLVCSRSRVVCLQLVEV